MKKLFIALTLTATLLPGCGSDFTPVTPDSGRRAHTAVAIGDKMYVFGGLGNGRFLNELWEYDFTTDVWSQKNPVTQGPGARTYAAAVTDGLGNMYVLGGYDGTNLSTPVFYRDIWKYTPNTGEGTWLPVTPTNMPALSGHSAVMNGTNIYIFGGYDGTDYVDDLWICNTVTGVCSIIDLGTGPTKRAFHSAVIASGNMYVFGGFGENTATGNNTVLNELWSYPLSGGDWTSIPIAPAVTDGPIPAARSKHTAVIATVDSKSQMLVFGGVGSTSNKIWLYDFGTEKWTESTNEFTTAPASRAAHSAIIDTINNKMYIYGGYVSSGATVGLNDLWEFVPEAAPAPAEWNQKASPPNQ